MADCEAPNNKQLHLNSADVSEADDLNALNNQAASKCDVNERAESLLRLPDACLLDICENLDAESLCNVADVCKRLRPIAVRAFPKHHQNLDLEAHNLSTFDRAIHKFGFLIRSIKSIQCDWYFNTHINAINKWCPILEELSIFDQVIDCDNINSLFSRMKVLNLSNCELVGDQKIAFSNCLQLVSLSIMYCNFDGINVPDYPKLERYDLALICYD